MNKSSVVFSFIAGLGIGSAITWFYAKKKYETIIEEEVTSARETYNQLGKELINKNNMIKEKMFASLDKELTKDLKEYEGIINDMDYSDDNTNNDSTEEPVKANITKPLDPYSPYEIDKDEYGTDDSYNLVSLNYYIDGVITDDMDEIVDSPEDILGEDILERLEKNQEENIDTIYIRNDTRRSDYEILLMGYNFYE